MRREIREAEKARKPKPDRIQQWVPYKDKYGHIRYSPVLLPTSALA